MPTPQAGNSMPRLADIIDPTKLVRTALVIIAEAMIAEKHEKKATTGGLTGGGMGDMDF